MRKGKRRQGMEERAWRRGHEGKMRKGKTTQGMEERA